MLCPGGIQIPFAKGPAAIEWSGVRFVGVDMRFLILVLVSESLFGFFWD
jgi:hypothetical protein